VIRTFADKDTERLFNREPVRRFQAFERVARRKLLQLNQARSLHDLRSPGNSLEKLEDDRQGQHCIRINDRYRLCFIWRNADSYEVEIADYH